MVTGVSPRYAMEFQTFTEREDLVWMWLEDQGRAQIYERWQRAEVIVATGSVVKAPAGEFYVQSQSNAKSSIG